MAAAELDADYGSLLLGGLLAFGLSGCVNMQLIMYWNVSADDRWTTKSLAVATWFLDLCHSVFVAAAIWESIISFYGDLDRKDIIPWSVGLTVELTAMVTFLVQCFFAHRLYKLQKRKFTVAGPVFALSFIRLVAASVSTAEMIKLEHYTAFVQIFPSWIFTLGLSVSAFTDIVITTFLCLLLRSNRSQIKSTNRIIDVLTFWIVQNGSITCCGATISLICWLSMPHNRIFLGVYFVVAKLYANSLLATLNSRTKLRNTYKFGTSDPTPPAVDVPGNESFEHEGFVSSQRMQPYLTNLDAYQLQRVGLKGNHSIQVQVQQTVISKYDDDAAMDVMSETAESIRETEKPWVVPA